MFGTKKILNQLLNTSLEEKLASVPLDERLMMATSKRRESARAIIGSIPLEGSYFSIDYNKRFDLVGPYEAIPYFFVANNEDERKAMKNTGEDYIQNHLVVLDNGIFFRKLERIRTRGQIDIDNEEGIFFSDGHEYFRNTQGRQLEKNEVPRGAWVNDSYWGCVGTPSRAWDYAVTGMIEYLVSFPLDDDVVGHQSFRFVDSNKIIFGSERCRDKIIKTFDKLGLKLIVS